MRILIVNIYFHPDPTGTGLIITELARDLVAQGHAVTVITSVPHYGASIAPPARGADGQVPSGDKLRGGCTASSSCAGPASAPPSFRAWTEERMDGIRVIRTAVYVPRRKTFWARALNYLSFSLLAMMAALRSGEQEVILCTSPPLLLGASVAWLSRLKRVPFVFNVQDIYPDAAILMGMLRNAALIALSRRLEKLIYARAALVTVLCEGAKQKLRARGVPEAKIVVIPNWVDVEYVRPLRRDGEFRRRLVESLEWSVERSGKEHRLSMLNAQHSTSLVMFAGNIGLIAGLETVLQAAARLRNRADIHFLIVGEGSAKADLVELAGKLDLPNVIFLPTQPRELLPELLAAADIHLVTLKRRMSATSVPSKSYGIMASGRPMVAAVDPHSEVWRLVEEAEAGICVPPEDPAELARAVEALCAAPELRAAMGENARAYVVRHHSRRDLTGRYGRTLELVVSGQWSVLKSEPAPLTTDR